MSAGLAYKFHGSTIAVLTGFEDADSPSHAISAITRANPAVVTSNAHGLQNGDVVRIRGVRGMDELNEAIFVVTDRSANTFVLADTDSSGYGAYTGGGSIDEGAMSNFCELTNYNRQGGSAPELPTTSLCSTAAEFLLGLRDFGTTQFDYKFAPRTAIQEAIAAFDASGDPFAVKVSLPNNGGVMVQLGFIQQTSEQAGVGGIWSASMTMRNTGSRIDIAA